MVKELSTKVTTVYKIDGYKDDPEFTDYNKAKKLLDKLHSLGQLNVVLVTIKVITTRIEL